MEVHTRRGQVHHGHAHGSVALEVHGALERRGANARTQAKGRVVGQGQCVFIVISPQHAGHGAKDFLARHAVLGAGQKEGGAHVVAWGGALQALATPDMLRPLIARDVDVAQVLCQLVVVHHRAHLGATLQRVAHFQVHQPVAQAGHKGVVHLGLDDEAARCGAALTGGEIRALQRAVHRLVQVGVGQHDERVLAAHLQLHLGAALAGRAQDAVARGD